MTNRLASVAREPGLAIASVPPGTATTLGYVRDALLDPALLAVAAAVVCMALGIAGVGGAALVLLALAGTGAAATRAPVVRRQLDRQRARRSQQRREADRLRRLRPAGPVRQHQYVELRALVGHIERLAPAEARRFDLQPLLDHFVGLAVDHQRCLDSLRLAGTGELPRTNPPPDPGRPAHRREIVARRLRHRDECVRQLDVLADELEAIEELVRLVAQRVACPQRDGELERELERRLWELDEVDAAMRQLSA